MRHGNPKLMCASALAFLAVATVYGQTRGLRTVKVWTPPRTVWGQPDLQGVWSWVLGTPLERPTEMTGKSELTDDELARAEQRARSRTNVDRRDNTDRDVDLGREFNEFWHLRRPRTLIRRTSLIQDPADGRLPPLTPEGEQKRAAKVAARHSPLLADSYTDRNLNERCLMIEANGPPILPDTTEFPVELLFGREFVFQIFQNSEYVVISSEEVQQARIIPLDGRPHLVPGIRQWIGDSRGHWEGTTLIIETTNLHLQRSIAGLPAEKMRVVERLTRSAPDAIDYQFTVDDPTTWTKPWTAAVPITEAQGGRSYEFACHEGNYGLLNILGTARVLERLAGDTTK
jgi:hypothetical protein